MGATDELSKTAVETSKAIRELTEVAVVLVEAAKELVAATAELAEVEGVMNLYRLNLHDVADVEVQDATIDLSFNEPQNPKTLSI